MTTPKVKINNIKVKPLPKDQVEEKKALGWRLFPEPYCNIFLCARKKSGKTTTIGTILKHCANEDTMVIIICSTIDMDPDWIAIQELLDERDIPFIKWTSIKDEEGNDRIKELLTHWKREQEEEAKALEEELDEDGEPKEHDWADPKEGEEKVYDFGFTPGQLWTPEGDKGEEEQTEQEEEKPKESKYRVPQYIFVFDDASSDLKNPSIKEFLKVNRHSKSKVILSSQYVKDILPEQCKQLDYWLVYQGHTEEVLKKIHKDADLHIDFNQFVKLYNDATKDKYCFLYIDARTGSFRKCFDKQYLVRE